MVITIEIVILIYVPCNNLLVYYKHKIYNCNYYTEY